MATIDSATGRRGAWISWRASAASHGSDSERKAALKHGQEATHVKDKTRDANLKQSQRKAGQYRREAKQKEREKAERAAAAELAAGDDGVEASRGVRYSPLRGEGASDFGP